MIKQVNTILKIENLHKSYGDKKILTGIDLEIKEGKIKVIMGASGCGKSTLIKCINRLVEPNKGKIFLKNINILDKKTDLKKLRQSIGFVFQNYALYSHLSALENVTLALRILKKMSKKEAVEIATKKLEVLGLGEQLDKYPSLLSGGQAQRVAIARVLVMDPQLIIFDEPTSALDPIMTKDVAKLLNKLKELGVTIICVTHDLALANFISDEVTFLYQGKVKAKDTLQNLINSKEEAISNFFNQGKL